MSYDSIAAEDFAQKSWIQMCTADDETVKATFSVVLGYSRT